MAAEQWVTALLAWLVEALWWKFNPSMENSWQIINHWKQADRLHWTKPWFAYMYGNFLFCCCFDRSGCKKPSHHQLLIYFSFHSHSGGVLETVVGNWMQREIDMGLTWHPIYFQGCPIKFFSMDVTLTASGLVKCQQGTILEQDILVHISLNALQPSSIPLKPPPCYPVLAGSHVPGCFRALENLSQCN